MMASTYARRMARLSARIFGEVYKPTTNRSLKVVKLMSEKPVYLQKRAIDYYPRHIETAVLMRYLRLLGLYRDEHEDFRDEMRRVAELKGKGKPKKGEGKRALKRKGQAQ